MAQRNSQPNREDLTNSRDARVVRRQLERHELYMNLLAHARRIGEQNGHDTSKLLEAITMGQSDFQRLTAKTGQRIARRRRPAKRNGLTPVRVFLDECGSHNLGDKDPFGAFALAAVLVPDIDYPALDAHWKKWKEERLGSQDKVVHEPDVRKSTGAFWFGNDPVKQTEVRESLAEEIAYLDFVAIVCVVNRNAYVKEVGDVAFDNSLPGHIYLMALDFMLERIALALEYHFGGAYAHLVAESRGSREDALLQFEYVRVHLDATSYIAPTWFRQQLSPGITFYGKKDNIAGLELADLLARPCCEKVLAPGSIPDRWPAFRRKLCPGVETAHSILGLKIVPWDDQYAGVWNS